MSAFELVMLAVGALVALTVVYIVIRLFWRLGREEVEPAGRDSDTFRRPHEVTDDQ